MASHHVHKHILKVQTDDEGKALLIQQQIIELARKRFKDILEKLLDQYELPNHTIRLESLQLDLGEIAEENLNDELPRQFAKALETALQKALAEVKIPGMIRENALSVKTIQRSEDDLVGYFLLHGRLPWWADHNAQTILALVEKKLRTSPQKFINNLRSIHHQPRVLERLAFQLPPTWIYSIIEQLASRETGFIATFLREQAAIFSSTYTASLRLHRQLLTQSLVFLFDTSKPFNRQAFIKYIEQFLDQKTGSGLESTPVGTQKEEEQDITIDHLRFFLEKGYFPEKVVTENPLLETQLLLLLQKRPASLATLFKGLNNMNEVSLRLQKQVSQKTFHQLIQFFAKDKNTSVRLFQDRQLDLYASLKESLSLSNYPLFKKEIQRLLLTHLLKEERITTPKELAVSIARQLAIKKNRPADKVETTVSPLFTSEQVNKHPNAWEALQFYLTRGFFPSKWKGAKLEPEALLLELLDEQRNIRPLFLLSDNWLLLLERIMEQFSEKTLNQLLQVLAGPMADLVLLMKEEMETQAKRLALSLPDFNKVLQEQLLTILLPQVGENNFADLQTSLKEALYQHFQPSAPKEIAQLLPDLAKREKNQKKPQPSIELDVVGHYLHYGHFPLWKPEDAAWRLAQEIRRLLKSSPNAFAALLRRLPAQEASERLVTQLEESLINQIIALLTGKSLQWVDPRIETGNQKQYTDLLRQLLENTPPLSTQGMEKSFGKEQPKEMATLQKTAEEKPEPLHIEQEDFFSSGKEPGEEKIKTKKIEHGDLIAYFRGDKGAKAWIDLEPLLVAEMAAQPLIMRNILWNIISREEYRIKLRNSLTEEAFWHFIELMHPRERPQIYAFEKDLGQLLNQQVIRFHLLTYIYDLNQGSFDMAVFVHRLFAGYANNPDRYQQLVASSIKFVTLTQLPTKKELLLILKGLSIEKREPDLKKAAKVVKKTTEEVLKELVYIPNAGLVILHPFFTRYFEVLRMTEKGAFKSEELAERGVHLLQYLVNGQTETPEHELVLNKILCGLPLSRPIMAGIDLKEEEIEMSATLLKSVIGNWEKMKHLPIGNFRGSFLLRAGRLEEKATTWQLKVETKAYDVLLDSLPWGISMVKMPWMEKILNIEWR